MLLAIDIGNTQVAGALFEGSEIKSHWRIASSNKRTEDETWVIVQAICTAHGLSKENIDGVAISSVVPDQTPVFARMAKKYVHMDPVIVSHELDLGIRICYENPASVGADRLCNAVAGFNKFGGPLIVVDLGTATTFDVISRQAEYLGGVIAPGIEMSSMILHQKAARLPRVELNFPVKYVGTTTENSIQSGLLYGTVEMIDGLVRKINRETGENMLVVATGGLAPLILAKCETIQKHEPFLTLEGLCMIYQRVKSQ
jgi:type III pantothenate kinase